MATTIPGSAAAITPAWLTEILRQHGALGPEASVRSIEIEALAAGVGFMGEVTRLRPVYEPSGAGPATLMAKIPTQSPEVRAMLAPARVFEREARFYQDVAPLVPGAVCGAHATAIDVGNDAYLLLLEDLAGLRMGDQRAGCSPDDAAATVEALAAFHARFWGAKELDQLSWMPACNDPTMKIGEMVYAASLPGFQALFGHAIHAENESLVSRFGPNAPQLLDRLAAMPTTIAHFDFRLDNLFFDTEPGGRGVVMIDFQASSKGGFAFDLGYFLSQSLSVEDRRAHEDDLLRAYHQRLVAGGVANYSFDQLRTDYPVGVLYGWIIPVFAVGTLDSSSERAMGLWTEVISRSQAAMTDHGVASLLTV
jgi:hypothetical protein